MAVDWGRLRESPFKGVRLFREDNQRLRYLAEEEIHALLDAVEEDPRREHLLPVVITALNTGMREGEILGLRRSDVNLCDGIITVRESKGGRSRLIPIGDELTAVLGDVIHRSRGDGDYFFCRSDGRPFHEVKRSFATALRRAGIRGFTFHDLRHTFASHFLMRGGDILVLNKILGHQDSRMTMRYAHLSPEYRKRASKVGPIPNKFPNMQERREDIISVSVRKYRVRL